MDLHGRFFVEAGLVQLEATDTTASSYCRGRNCLPGLLTRRNGRRFPLDDQSRTSRNTAEGKRGRKDVYEVYSRVSFGLDVGERADFCSDVPG